MLITRKQPSNMFYAKSQETSSFDVYSSFLTDLIETNNENYKSIFKNIVLSSKHLSVTGDPYSVDKERFEIICFLASKDEVINQIDADNLTTDDYRKLLNCINAELAF